MKEIERDLLAVGPCTAVFWSNDRQLGWVATSDADNAFSGVIGLPPGLTRGSVIGAACDRGIITLVTKDRLFVYSHNVKTWTVKGAPIVPQPQEAGR